MSKVEIDGTFHVELDVEIAATKAGIDIDAAIVATAEKQITDAIDAALKAIGATGGIEVECVTTDVDKETETYEETGSGRT